VQQDPLLEWDEMVGLLPLPRSVMHTVVIDCALQHTAMWQPPLLPVAVVAVIVMPQVLQFAGAAAKGRLEAP
jgi:hypothetical protein